MIISWISGELANTEILTPKNDHKNFQKYSKEAKNKSWKTKGSASLEITVVKAWFPLLRPRSITTNCVKEDPQKVKKQAHGERWWPPQLVNRGGYQKRASNRVFRKVCRVLEHPLPCFATVSRSSLLSGVHAASPRLSAPPPSSLSSAPQTLLL